MSPVCSNLRPRIAERRFVFDPAASGYAAETLESASADSPPCEYDAAGNLTFDGVFAYTL